MSEPFLGEIRMFAGNFAPRGWAFCDGQLLAIVDHEALFSLVGTTYGGDGEDTFGLPDLRGRIPVGPRNGPGLSPVALGQRGGVESVALSLAQVPVHDHPLNASTDPASNAASPAGGLVAEAEAPLYAPSANRVDLVPPASPGGGAAAHDNMAPSLTVHFIIALAGIFPS